MKPCKVLPNYKSKFIFTHKPKAQKEKILPISCPSLILCLWRALRMPVSRAGNIITSGLDL